MRHGWLAIGIVAAFVAMGLPAQSQEFNAVELLLPADPERGSNFGQSVAAVPGWVAVGAPSQKSVHGSGQVHIYDLEAPHTPHASMSAQSTSSRFGSSLTWSGDWLFIGDWQRGFVEAHQRVGDSFQYVQTIRGQSGERFGFSLDSGPGSLVVGAPGSDEYSVLSPAGKVYHYGLEGSTWRLQETLSRGGLGAERQFGYDVGLDGKYLVVGAPARYWTEEVFAGGAWFFERVGNQWVERTRVQGDTQVDRYGKIGASVDLHGSWAIVAGNPILINGIWYDAHLSFYRREGSVWRAYDSWYDDAFQVELGPQGALISHYYRGDVVLLWQYEAGHWQPTQSLDNGMQGLGAGLAWAGGRPVAGAPFADTAGRDTGAVVVFGYNQAPVAVAGPDITIADAGETSTVRLDGSKSYDPDGTIVHYEWDVAGEHLHDAATEVTLAPGTYTARLTVYDDDGLTGSDTLQIAIKESPRLRPGFTFTPDQRPPGTVVQFEDKTLDETGVVMQWEWDFDGDHATDATGMAPKQVFETSGKHVVRLTVTNHHGVQAHIERTVTVRDAPPLAHAGQDIVTHVDGTKAAEVTLDGTASSDMEGPIKSWQWYDQARRPVGQGAEVKVTVTEGLHRFTLDVRDQAGQVARDEVRVLAVASGGGPNGTTYDPPKPTVDFTTTPLDQTRVVRLTGEASARDSEIALWQWDMDGDGVYDAGERVVDWTFEDYKPHLVALKVTSMEGAANSVTNWATPRNDAPTAAIQPTWLAEVPVGAPVVFVDHSTDPEQELVSWRWSFGDGTASSHTDIGHIFTKPGTYTIRLEVKDEGGLEANATGKVRVLDVGEDVAAEWSQEEALAAQEEGRSLLEELQETASDPAGQANGTQGEGGPSDASERGNSGRYRLAESDGAATIPMPPWWILALVLALVVLLVVIAVRRR